MVENKGEDVEVLEGEEKKQNHDRSIQSPTETITKEEEEEERKVKV